MLRHKQLSAYFELDRKPIRRLNPLQSMFVRRLLQMHFTLINWFNQFHIFERDGAGAP